MADNIILPGTGEKIDTEEIGGDHIQRFKIAYGDYHVATSVNDTNPLPVSAGPLKAPDSSTGVESSLFPATTTYMRTAISSNAGNIYWSPYYASPDKRHPGDFAVFPSMERTNTTSIVIIDSSGWRGWAGQLAVSSITGGVLRVQMLQDTNPFTNRIGYFLSNDISSVDWHQLTSYPDDSKFRVDLKNGITSNNSVRLNPPGQRLGIRIIHDPDDGSCVATYKFGISGRI